MPLKWTMRSAAATPGGFRRPCDSGAGSDFQCRPKMVGLEIQSVALAVGYEGVIAVAGEQRQL